MAVFGAGPVGLLVMAIARASGAHPIAITDVDAKRLECSNTFEPFCFTHRVDVTATARESAIAVRKLFSACSSENSESAIPALVLECTGIESSIATASYTVRRGGRINVVGVAAKPLLNNITFIIFHLSNFSYGLSTGTMERGLQALRL